MRRAQSTRNRPRPSGYAIATDELGSMGESEDSAEDSLRRQLIDKERENDKLVNQIHILQTQLQQRPPLETLQALREDHKQTEILLQGTQRENEKCLNELARSKERERVLEKELQKLLGDNWQAKLDIMPMPSSSPTHARRPSAGSPVTPISSGPRRQNTADSINRATAAKDNTSNPPNNSETLALINQMRTLILGMESRLSTREDVLTGAIQRAEGEAKKYEGLVKDGAVSV